MTEQNLPATLGQLRESGWRSKTVKQEVYDNFVTALADGRSLFPGIVGYDDTVIPEVSLAILSRHDLLILGEKGQAKSRLMRSLASFLDPWLPYLDCPTAPVHEDPFRPISRAGQAFLAEHGDAALLLTVHVPAPLHPQLRRLQILLRVEHSA